MIFGTLIKVAATLKNVHAQTFLTGRSLYGVSSVFMSELQECVPEVIPIQEVSYEHGSISPQLQSCGDLNVACTCMQQVWTC